MKKQKLLQNEQGFTLVEIIAVLIILGILAAVAVPRYIDLEKNAKQRAIDAAISEINGRESLVWANHKISVSGWKDDDYIWQIAGGPAASGVSYSLGADYSWRPGMTAAGGKLVFKKGTAVSLTRDVSTVVKPGVWTRE